MKVIQTGVVSQNNIERNNRNRVSFKAEATFTKDASQMLRTNLKDFFERCSDDLKFGYFNTVYPTSINRKIGEFKVAFSKWTENCKGNILIDKPTDTNEFLDLIYISPDGKKYNTGQISPKEILPDIANDDYDAPYSATIRNLVGMIGKILADDGVEYKNNPFLKLSNEMELDTQLIFPSQNRVIGFIKYNFKDK